MRQNRGEAEAHVELGLNGDPAGFIIHGTRSELSWLVWEVLEKWAMPYPQRPARDSHAEVDRFRVRVGGPLPGRPAEYGNFVMIVRRYADDPPGAWWISPGPGLSEIGLGLGPELGGGGIVQLIALHRVRPIGMSVPRRSVGAVRTE